MYVDINTAGLRTPLPEPQYQFIVDHTRQHGAAVVKRALCTAAPSALCGAFKDRAPRLTAAPTPEPRYCPPRSHVCILGGARELLLNIARFAHCASTSPASPTAPQHRPLRLLRLKIVRFAYCASTSKISRPHRGIPCDSQSNDGLFKPRARAPRTHTRCSTQMSNTQHTPPRAPTPRVHPPYGNLPPDNPPRA